MAKIKEEDLRLNIIVNGADSARKTLDDYKTSLRDAQDHLDTLQKKQKALESTNRTSSKEYQKLSKEITSAQASVDSYKKKLSDLERQQKLNKMTLSELQKHLKLTKIALSQAVPGTQNWKNLQKEISATSDRLKQLQSSGSALGTLFKGGAIAAFVRVSSNAVDKIADFEQANVNLSTILGVNVKQLKLLTDDALELGRRTQYTASQVTGLQTELAKLGFTQDQIYNMTAPTLDFATAVGTDLSSAASLAGATLRIFGLNAEDTEEALGVLAVATNKSALDFSYLQTAMSTVGPVAKSFGFSIQDTTALLGTLANAGFDASSAATATRNILLNLADSSGKLATALGGPVKTFPELMDGLKTLRDRGVDLNEALELTDKRSVSAFSSFLSGAESALELRDALSDVTGELDRIAGERMNTVHGAILGLQSAWEGLMLAFRNGAGPIKAVINGLSDIVNRMTDIISGDKLTVWEALFGPVAGGFIASRRRKNKGDGATEQGSVSESDVYGVWLTQGTESGSSSGKSGRSGGKGKKGSGSGAGVNGNRTRSWNLENDEAFLMAKAALLEKYNSGEIATQEAFDEELYQLETASLTARLALNKEKGAEREKIESSLQAKIKAHKDKVMQQEAELVKFQDSLEIDKTQIAINAENRRYEEQIKTYKKLKGAINVNDADVERMKERHAKNLLDIEIDRINRMRALASQEHANAIAGIKNEHADRMLQYKNGSAKEREEIRAQNLKIAEMDVEYFRQYVDEIQKMIAEAESNTTGASAEDTRKTLADLTAKLQEAYAKLYAAQEIINGENEGLFSGSGQGSLFGVSADQWETLFERIKHGTLQAKDLSSILEGVGEAAAEGMRIAQLSIDKTNAKEQKALDKYKEQNDEKRKALEAMLSANLMTQEQYDAEIERLDKEQAQKEEDMQLKQAQREKRMAITQATIDGALSVAKTLAAFAWPASLVPAGIAAALAATQVALIANTPISAGYAQGGLVTREQDGRRFPARLSPNARGYISSPTILVGEEGGEYVIPAAGLQNPSLAPFIGSIETARRAGTLRSINFGAIYPAMPALAMASGGFSAPSGAGGPVSANTDTARLVEGINRILEKMDDRPPVEVPLLGRRGIRAAEEKYERYRNNGRI